MSSPARLLAVVAFSIGVSLHGAAQEVVSTCEETLGKAEDEFNGGRFYGIPVILGDCLSQFSRDQRFRAYLLLVQTYLLIDDQENAEKSYIEVLKTDPEFVPSAETESVDIVNLSKKFTSTAIFTPHGKVGLALTIPRIVERSELYGMPPDSRNLVRPGWNVGGGLEWNATQKWGVGAELFLGFKSYTQEARNFFQQDVTQRISRQTWIDVPLYVRYTDDVGQFRPFGYAGFALNLLLQSTSQSELIDFTSAGGGEGDAPFQVPNASPPLDVKHKQRVLSRSFVFGGGVKYKIGRDFLIVDARYMAGMKILNKEDRQFYDRGDTFTFDSDIPRFAFLNDFFRLDNLIFNVGYVRPLYQPRKIKRGGGILSFLNRRGKSE